MPDIDIRGALETLKQRGLFKQIAGEDNLQARLKEGPLSFYCGFDPTAESLHIGNYVSIVAMAHLARAGHRPIALLGGGTARVGDPSGKTELRKLLSPEQIDHNREKIARQITGVFSALGVSDVEIVNNADWLAGLNYIDFLRNVGRHFSVNRMLAAEAYKIRLEKGLSFLEFNYQILQAYDFLVLNQKYGCTLQVGGDDQWGNIVAGIDLIRRVESKESYALTFPLLTTSTGAKMGKTAKGALWLDPALTSPFDFYQYFINVDDPSAIEFVKQLTLVSDDEIARLSKLEGAEIREAKQILAYEITKIIHGQENADKAKTGAASAFSGAGGSVDIPAHSLNNAALGDGMLVVDLLADVGLAKSRSAARRLVEQGGARINDDKVGDVKALITQSDFHDGELLLRAGKKHLRRILLED